MYSHTNKISPPGFAGPAALLRRAIAFNYKEQIIAGQEK